MDQTEKNSVRAYVFRFTLELGQCGMQAACLKCAKTCREQTQQRAPLVDRLVGEDQDRIRDRQPDRLRGSEIEDHVELRGLFHG